MCFRFLLLIIALQGVGILASVEKDYFVNVFFPHLEYDSRRNLGEWGREILRSQKTFPTKKHK